ncbi:hypothetical protein CLOSTHATH_01764 [Hungatella hathewayi DSM 13479]|uniref:Uncharacterized protein n=1 Tax=Hungatella hathewayi DSM 13479 TaxID=566550 RepID=D3ADT5_9FIRM|nr:hypothetical protein CLOSTHATH_01764 [Hungatella hathewayi DSM 13479]
MFRIVVSYSFFFCSSTRFSLFFPNFSVRYFRFSIVSPWYNSLFFRRRRNKSKFLILFAAILLLFLTIFTIIRKSAATAFRHAAAYFET